MKMQQTLARVLLALRLSWLFRRLFRHRGDTSTYERTPASPPPPPSPAGTSDSPGLFPEEPLDEPAYIGGGYYAVTPGENLNNGRYTILRKLGWGTAANVWLAIDTK